MEKIKQQMIEINSFNHKTYIDNSNISNQGLKILECKNKNYYIVPEKQEYNEDIFNFKVQTSVRMSGFDVIYSFVFTIINIVKDKLNKKFKKVN